MLRMDSDETSSPADTIWNCFLDELSASTCMWDAMQADARARVALKMLYWSGTIVESCESILKVDRKLSAARNLLFQMNLDH